MKLTHTIAASTCLLIFAGCMGESTHDKMMRIAEERSKIRAADIERDEATLAAAPVADEPAVDAFSPDAVCITVNGHNKFTLPSGKQGSRL